MAERSTNCFKCGKEGHIARNCTEGILLFDAAGEGNTGGNREKGGSTCYNCNKTGHFARECTEERKERGDRGGFRGGERGDREDRGGYRGDREDRGGRGGDRNNDIQCYNCQKYGHMARDCKKGNPFFHSGRDRPTECYNCHKEGHIARECPEGDKREGGNREDRKKTIECHNCHEVGHFARDCTSNLSPILDK